MKNIRVVVSSTCAVLLAGAANVHAQYSSDAPVRTGPGYSYMYIPYLSGPVYVGADLGGSLLQDMDVKNNGTKLTWDAGTRFDVNFGFYVAPPVSIEFETGVIWNQAAHHDTALTANDMQADLYQVPLMANLVFHIPLANAGQFYVGGGAGGVISDITIYNNNHHYYYHDYNDSDSDLVFAYQALAGFKFPVWRNMEVGVGYKFLGSLDHSWFDGDSNFYTHTTPTYSHSILASFTATF